MTGSVAFNLVAAEGFFLVVFTAWFWLTYPNVPWDTLNWVLPAGVVVFPILFYPFSKTLYLAFDLLVRPPDARELGGPTGA